MQAITPDSVVFARWGPLELNLTIVSTWGVMALLVLVSWLVTRRLSTGKEVSRAQSVLEVIVSFTARQIRDVTDEDPRRYLGFIGTLFLFILVSNVLTLFPVYEPPTASLSTTAALAICVFLAVPIYGIASGGFWAYFREYAKPSLVMLPFNVMGELTRTLALAVRLFGNIMSGSKIVGIFLALAPLFFPIIMRVLGIVTGAIQAYIFAILATVYIGAATRANSADRHSEEEKGEMTHG